MGTERRALWRYAVLFCCSLLLGVTIPFSYGRPGGRAEAAPGLDRAPTESAPTAAERPALDYSSSPSAPRDISVAATSAHPAYTLYTPGGWADAGPRGITLVVMHGMGGNGPGMAATILPFARAQGWTVLAPTVPYGDWRDPTQLVGEELGLQPQLAGLLDAVPAETGVTIPSQVMLFGFSRGAQAALRFALLYPERVQAVAACSAGTYTLPARTVKTAAGPTIAAPLPYGVADIEQRAGRAFEASEMAAVRFLIGVGANDNREGDVPRQWDQFLGKTRLERAERFAAVLTQLGLPARAVVVPDTGHELSTQMMNEVTTFLTGVAGELQARSAAAITTEPALPMARHRRQL